MSGVAPAGRLVRADPAPSGSIARRERFAVVGSTNDVVRGWLAEGEPEVCLAIADRQSAGRGRAGRTWLAPDGAALLLSLGFRPAWLAPDRTWRLAAIVALAMAEAAEDASPGCRPAPSASSGRTTWWSRTADRPIRGPGLPRKLAGLLGETDGLGTADPRATIGIGVNVAWPAADFPPDLAGGDDEPRRAVRRAVRSTASASSTRSSPGSSPRSAPCVPAGFDARRWQRSPADDRPDRPSRAARWLGRGRPTRWASTRIVRRPASSPTRRRRRTSARVQRRDRAPAPGRSGARPPAPTGPARAGM